MNSIMRKIAIVFLALVLLSAIGYGVYQFLHAREDVAPIVSNDDPPAGAPRLNATVLASNLDHPWDIAFLPDSTMLFTERAGTISKLTDGAVSQIEQPDDVVAQGEGGMLGLAVDPDFDNNRFIYACFNSSQDNRDVRVVRWTLNSQRTSLSDRKDIVTGMPANQTGRHSGCRIDFGPDGNLWIGTGDAAEASAPQSLNSLGGKILRVDREGNGVSGNNTNGDDRIFSYGHRNTQGLAFFDAEQNEVFGYSAEHGSDRDDEINPLKTGNFGWSPGAGYDESVPMNDSSRFADAVPAIWSSGDPTIAISDLAILKGSQWKDWQNRLAVAVLKDKHLRLLQITNEKVTNEQRLLGESYGRLRAAVLGPDGSLYISTDNGGDQDRIIRLTPVE